MFSSWSHYIRSLSSLGATIVGRNSMIWRRQDIWQTVEGTPIPGVAALLDNAVQEAFIAPPRF